MRLIQTLLTTLAAATALLAGAASAAPAPTDLWVVDGNDAIVGAVDAASLRRSGDVVSVTMVTLTRATAKDGADYRVGHDLIDCAARTWRRTDRVDYALGGAVVSTDVSNNFPQAIPPNSIADREFDFVCAGARDYRQEEGVNAEQVLMTVRFQWPIGPPSESYSADYYLYGFNDTIAKGMDVATLRRRGSLAIYKSVAVFKRPDANGFDYVISEEEIDCAAHTSHLVTAEGYRLGRIQAGPYPFDDDGPGPIPPASMGELEYTFACNGVRTPSMHVGGHDANAIAVYVRGDWPVH